MTSEAPQFAGSGVELRADFYDLGAQNSRNVSARPAPIGFNCGLLDVPDVAQDAVEWIRKAFPIQSARISLASYLRVAQRGDMFPELEPFDQLDDAH